MTFLWCWIIQHQQRNSIKHRFHATFQPSGWITSAWTCCFGAAAAAASPLSIMLHKSICSPFFWTVTVFIPRLHRLRTVIWQVTTANCSLNSNQVKSERHSCGNFFQNSTCQDRQSQHSVFTPSTEKPDRKNRNTGENGKKYLKDDKKMTFIKLKKGFFFLMMCWKRKK